MVSFVDVARLELSRIAGLFSQGWEGGSCALVGEITITSAMILGIEYQSVLSTKRIELDLRILDSHMYQEQVFCILHLPND